jgi:hypothetical protein
MKNKEFAILRKDRTILVKTPIPYVVNVYKDPEMVSLDRLMEIKYELEEHTKFLYNCLKMLGISKAMAIKHKYTLNHQTGDALSSIASHNPKISHEMRMVIFRHEW